MGFGHSANGIKRLCVELASIIHANFHVAAAINPIKRSCSLYVDFDAHYESLINTKTIELAVNLRALLERCAAYSNPHPLVQAVNQTTAISFLHGRGPTTLRECANKIIHADYFVFSYGRYDSVDENSQPFSNPVQESTVEISGRFGKELWRCRLNLLQFAEEAHLAAAQLELAYGQ